MKDEQQLPPAPFRKGQFVELSPEGIKQGLAGKHDRFKGLVTSDERGDGTVMVHRIGDQPAGRAQRYQSSFWQPKGTRYVQRLEVFIAHPECNLRPGQSIAGKLHEDVKNIDWEKIAAILGPIEMMTESPPCKSFSAPADPELMREVNEATTGKPSLDRCWNCGGENDRRMSSNWCSSCQAKFHGGKL